LTRHGLVGTRVGVRVGVGSCRVGVGVYLSLLSALPPVLCAPIPAAVLSVVVSAVLTVLPVVSPT
jgi:hypothetical protein